MASLTFKEKLCTILKEVFDKNKDIIASESSEALAYDAVELTLLLKAIGFRLHSLEFENLRNAELNDIEVEIKCGNSGITSKLSLKSECTCPLRKPTNNNSFWEIQGTGPNTPGGKAKDLVQETSCNLLPDVTKRTSDLSRTMLTVLLQRFKDDTKSHEETKSVEVKQVVENLQMKRKSLDKPQELNGANLISPIDKTALDPNSHCSTPLSSINVTPVPSYDGPIVNVFPKIILNGVNGNGEEQLIENEKPPDDSTQMASSIKIESLATSPAETDAETYNEKLNMEAERDICLIKSISEARTHLDSALLMLKCNVTRDMSHSSILTVTPQSLKQIHKPPPSPSKRKSLLVTSGAPSNIKVPDVNRRHSTGGATRRDPKTGIGSSNYGLPKDVKRRSIGPLSGSKFNQDTPRPLDSKKTIGKVSEANEKFGVKRASTGTNLRSSTLVKNQVSKSIPRLSTVSTKK